MSEGDARFLDTNILLRYLLRDDEEKARRAIDLYATQNISFPDAFHAAYMNSRGIEKIYSGDRDFDRLEGITRVEP